jgi:hypothetical protein
LRRLEGLDVSNTTITDKAVYSLEKCPELVALDLSGTLVTDEGLSRLELPATASAIRIANLHLKVETIMLLGTKYRKCRIDQQPGGTLGDYVFP